MEYLDNLNPNQKEAVIHDNGPCLVIAGAGSGKTRVLTYRIAHLIKKGTDPYSILALTAFLAGGNHPAIGEQSTFAYDIRQGSNSIWYATGIFIR